MNFQNLFQDFNPGKFVVYLSLLVFVGLFSLRLDGVIKISYWAVFSPLWTWKLLTVVAAGIGIHTRRRRAINRMDLESNIQFRSMLLSFSLNLVLLLFEILACDKLQSTRHIWILVFLPLLFLSVICIAVSVWALKHERPFEIELFGAVNLLQFIFIALRLDGFIVWKWELVFIPLWVIYAVAVIGLTYCIILAAVFSRSSHISTHQRRASSHVAIGCALLVIPSLSSQILLTKKLDGELDMPFSVVNVPLLVALTSLVLRSFHSRGGNLWWCGMQRDFCLFLFELFPVLREYGNISYQTTSDQLDPESTSLSQHPNQLESCKTNTRTSLKSDTRILVPILPILSIDIPD